MEKLVADAKKAPANFRWFTIPRDVHYNEVHPVRKDPVNYKIFIMLTFF